jgi:hypothetical protein
VSYTQILAESPALMSGRQYHYFIYGETIYSASGDFTMMDGKPVITQAQ